MMERTQSVPSRALVLLAVLAIGILLLLATASGATGSSEAPAEPTTYTVVAGDTLWSIAGASYGEGINVRDAVDEIKDLNDLESPVISIGEVLLLPVLISR